MGASPRFPAPSPDDAEVRALWAPPGAVLELGARLFRRTKRRVEHTPAGQAFPHGGAADAGPGRAHRPRHPARGAWRARRTRCRLRELRHLRAAPRHDSSVSEALPGCRPQTPKPEVGAAAAGLGRRTDPQVADPRLIQGFKRKGVVYRPLRPQTFRTEMGLAWRPDDDSALVQQSAGSRARRRAALRTDRHGHARAQAAAHKSIGHAKRLSRPVRRSRPLGLAAESPPGWPVSGA